MLMSAEAFENRLLSVIDDESFWPKHSAVFILAYSGGPDSQALLQALMRLKKTQAQHAALKDARIVVAHFKHLWKPEKTAAEEAFCQKMAEDWGLVFHSADPAILKEEAKNLSLPIDALGETAARSYRHAYLAQLKQSYEIKTGLPVYILLGHQRDDKVETLLLNLFRGSGIEGLTAMPQRSAALLRPLLGFSKAELLAYLELIGVSYLEDASNAEAITPRNRIRNELLPLIGEMFPRATEQMLCCSEQLAEIKSELLYPALEKAREELLTQKILCHGLNASEELALFVDKTSLRSVPAFLRNYLWKALFQDFFNETQNLTAAHYSILASHLADSKARAQAFYLGSRMASDKFSLRLWKNTTLTDYYISFRDFATLETKILFFSSCPEPSKIHALFEKAGTLSYNFLTWFKQLEALGEGQWRSRRSTDYIRLKNGQKKSLKKFMSEQAIPFELRNTCLVFCQNDEVLYLPSYFLRDRENSGDD